ncbi:hypothetical protein [Dactylosporangium sp. NPDC050588]|uniref:hypothetical protein n=1 Tax=Dactylosporangium sp. NPDC050588 TaxID=3157211 RepID=UPI0034116282
MDLEGLRQAAEAGDAGAARELGHRLCVLEGASSLETPDDVPEAEGWLRRALAAEPADPVTATLLAGLLLRQFRTVLEFSPLYDGTGDRQAWLRSLWGRRAEAFELYGRALDADPAHAAAANGMALLVLDESTTDDFVCYTGEDEPEDLDAQDPAWRAEAARRLRALLALRPRDTMAAAHLAAVLGEPSPSRKEVPGGAAEDR